MNRFVGERKKKENISNFLLKINWDKIPNLDENDVI
jgi:hypothetical protein